jgi:hypothetical protein
MQLYRYFVSQSSEFCRHNSLYSSQRELIVVSVYFSLSTQSGNFWIHTYIIRIKGEKMQPYEHLDLLIFIPIVHFYQILLINVMCFFRDLVLC